MSDIDNTPTEDTPEAAPADDRRALLEQQFDDVGPDPTERATEAPAKTYTRDEVGKFAPAQGAPKAAQEPAEEPLWRRPPKSWKPDYHEVWKTADPRLQEYAYQREVEMDNGVRPLVEKARFADEISKTIEPYMNTIRGLGTTAPAAIKGLLEADNILRTSQPETKLAYLVNLAQHYGVDLRQLSGAPQAQQAVDPNYHHLANELNRVRGEVMTWKEQQEAAQNQVLVDEIARFSQGKEHFETVRPTMVALLQSGQAETLDEAYRKAIRLDDNLYQAEISATQGAAQAAKREAADKAAKSARAAAVSVRGSTPGTPTPTKAQDRRSMLAEQFDSLSDRL